MSKNRKITDAEPPPAFEVRTPAQLRAIGTPASGAIIEVLSSEGPMVAADLADRLGMSRQSVHYHLGKLLDVGLVRVSSERPTGRRPEKVFAMTASNVHLTQGKRRPAFRKEMLRVARLFLRRAGEDYERAVVEKTDERHPGTLRLTRNLWRLGPDDAVELERRLEALNRWLDKADRKDKPLAVRMTVVVAATEA